MKDSQKFAEGSIPGPETSAASHPPAAAASASHAACTASLSSTSSGTTTSTTSSFLRLPGGGRGAASARNCPPKKDIFPPLVTRSATTQIPPGMIMTKQALVRVKPCPANRSNVESSSSSGSASSSSTSRSGLTTNTGKDSSDLRHSSNSSREGRLNTLRVSSSHTRQPNPQQKVSASGGLLGTGGKKNQETEIVGNSAAAFGAISASTTHVRVNMSRKEAAAAQELLHRQQRHTQKRPQSPPQQHVQQQQQQSRQQQLQQLHPPVVQEKVLSEETNSSKKEESQGVKAGGVRGGTTKAKPKTKVVVRLLPPSVTEEELLALVPEELKGQITWRKFYPGSHVSTASAGNGGSDVKTSVWFLNCTSPAAAEELIRLFHSKCFVDERHITFKATAALAPYQKTPRKKATENKLEGQIEDEPLYASFLETLNNGVSVDAQGPRNSGMEQLEILRDDDGAPITAMLLETRERYNVKTTVNGHLYTLAMWRQNLSLLNGGAVHG